MTKRIEIKGEIFHRWDSLYIMGLIGIIGGFLLGSLKGFFGVTIIILLILIILYIGMLEREKEK